MDKMGCLAVVVGSILLCLLLFLFAAFSVVPAGHVGIVSNFGQVEDRTLSEGLSFLAPWKKVTKISLQTKEDKEDAQAPTKEGLSVKLEVSLLYSLSKEKAAFIYQSVGANYEEVIVKPQFRSAIRSATTHYEAKDLYTAHREQIEGALFKDVKAQLEPKGIVVSQVLLRDVQMPPVVKERIEAKLAAEQDAQRMTFVIQKETQDAERKRVEAKGIADAQNIIKKELTHEYLIYLWISALEKHSGSTIYIPTGNDGLPFFKNVGKETK